MRLIIRIQNVSSKIARKFAEQGQLIGMTGFSNDTTDHVINARPEAHFAWRRKSKSKNAEISEVAPYRALIPLIVYALLRNLVQMCCL